MKSSENLQFTGFAVQALADFRETQYCQYRLTHATSNRGVVKDLGLINFTQAQTVNGKLSINGKDSVLFAETSAYTGKVSGVVARGESVNDLYSATAEVITAGQIEASQVTIAVPVFKM